MNGVDIKTLHHGHVVNLIKESGYSVTLTIGPPRGKLSYLMDFSYSVFHSLILAGMQKKK